MARTVEQRLWLLNGGVPICGLDGRCVRSRAALPGRDVGIVTTRATPPRLGAQTRFSRPTSRRRGPAGSMNEASTQTSQRLPGSPLQSNWAVRASLLPFAFKRPHAPFVR